MLNIYCCYAGNHGNRYNDMFELNSRAIFGLWDCSKCFNLYRLAESFNRAPSRPLWKNILYAAINARILLAYIYPPLPILINTAE